MPNEKFIEETMNDYRAKFGETYCDGNCIMFNEVVPNFILSALLSQRIALLAEIEAGLPEERKERKITEQEITEDEKTFDEGFNFARSAVKQLLTNIKK